MFQEVFLFLKSVEMMGFKSFADRTRIEFSGGISALLGPNGSGKRSCVTIRPGLTVAVMIAR